MEKPKAEQKMNDVEEVLIDILSRMIAVLRAAVMEAKKQGLLE